MKGWPLLLALSITGLAQGQAEDDRLFLPLDREASEDFERLDRLAEREQWDRVVSELDRLLEGGGAKLIERDGSFLTVRAEARRRLLVLPAEGQRAYDLSHEGPARRLYERGLDEPGVVILEELLAEHPAAAQADKARRLLAARYFEQGKPGAALIQLEALLAKLPSIEEQGVLLRLRVLCLAAMGRQGESRLALGELDLPAPEDEQLGGQVTRLRPADPPPPPPVGAPLAWAGRTFGYYDDDGFSAPWSLPRADVRWLYAHDGSHAQALDLATGKLTWRTPLTPFDAFARPVGLCRLALAQRQVVCVLPGQLGGLVGLERLTGTTLWTQSLTQLKAAAEIDFPAHLSGRPEVIGDVVAISLVTDHTDREVHVLGVDVETGALAWHAFLGSQSGGRVPLPYLTQGLERIFVVTGLGAVAALDLSGEVQWLRKYKSKRDEKDSQQGPFPPGFRMPGQPEAQGPRERDPSALVSRGLLWAAPADAAGFVVWDARTGEPRGKPKIPADGRILAAWDAGVLVLSEATDLYQVSREGTVMLRQVGGSLVARPEVHGHHVFIPRADGVVQVDLKAGSVNLFNDWSASGGPGNVIVAGRRVVVGAHRGLFAWGDLVGDASEARATTFELASSSYERREAASAALLEGGEPSRPALATLEQETPDPEVRLRARVVLGELDRQARLARWAPLIKQEWEAQVADLLNRLTHPNPEVRLAALRKMGTIQDDDVLALLHDLLDDDDPRVAFNSAISLLTRDDRTGIERVARTLREGPASDRLTAATILGKVGSAEDLAMLTPALEADEANVRAAAAQSMLRLGGRDALDAVLPLLDDPADEVRLAVLTGIETNGIDAKQAVRALAKAAQDTNDQIREKAVDALVRDELRHPDVFLALGLALGDEVQRIAKKAGRRLFRMAQRTDDEVLMIPPQGIERGARLEDPILRGYVAQIALFYAQVQLERARDQAANAEHHEAQGHHGSQLLSVETLARFMSDSNPRIRTLRVVGGPNWAGLLIQRAEGAVLAKADVAAISSLSLDEAYAVRHDGYLALTKALEAPGRGRLLAGALADTEAALREQAVDWLVPTEGNDLLDVAATAKVLALSLREGESPPGGLEARRVLERLDGERALALMVPVLRSWPDEAVRRAAGGHLSRATGAEVAFDPGRDDAAQADAFALWAWRRTHPDQQPADLLAQLGDKNPSNRWRAAQAAAELPIPLIRNGVIASLGTEPVEWVLKVKLQSAVAITGETLGFHDRLRGDELRACARRFQTWLSNRLADESRGR